MKKDKLDIIYRAFVKCSNKQTYALDITRYYKELKYILIKTDVIDNIQGVSCKLITDLFISSFAYSMFDFKEILLEMLARDYPFLEPEAEILIITYFKDVMDSLYASVPILRDASIILPYDIIQKECETFTLKFAICLDKNN